MSEEIRNNEHDPATEFEHQDLSPRAVYSFLIGLAIAGVVIYFVLWGLYDLMDAYEKKHQPRQNPLAQQTTADTRMVTTEDITKFPQPRLERNERIEIKDFRLKEEQTLNSYGWVDEKAGVVRIPIERAMQLIAQRGLPTTARVGTTPVSEVSPAAQAAQKADTSNTAPAPKGKKQ